VVKGQTYRGKWKAGADYERNQTVIYDGRYYRAEPGHLARKVNRPPSIAWKVVPHG